MEKGRLRDVHERAISVGARGSLAAYFEINKEFHDLICAGAHNSTLDLTARDLRFRLSPFRRPEPKCDAGEVIGRSTAEHAAIVKAIVSGDAEVAYEAMRAHDARVNLGAMKLLQNADTARRPPKRARS
jgi:DNA-binding GntR family transcriptional regulator